MWLKLWNIINQVRKKKKKREKKSIQSIFHRNLVYFIQNKSARLAPPLCLQICYQLWLLKLTKWQEEKRHGLNTFYGGSNIQNQAWGFHRVLSEKPQAACNPLPIWLERPIATAHKKTSAKCTRVAPELQRSLHSSGDPTVLLPEFLCYKEVVWDLSCCQAEPSADNVRTSSGLVEPFFWGQQVEIPKCLWVLSDLVTDTSLVHPQKRQSNNRITVVPLNMITWIRQFRNCACAVRVLIFTNWKGLLVTHIMIQILTTWQRNSLDIVHILLQTFYLHLEQLI